MEDEKPVEQAIAEAADWLRRERPRAGFFAWPDRALAEKGVAQTFAEAAESEPGFPLTNIQFTKRDPPDCTAYDAHGKVVAIEVTELVDAEANALAKRDRSRVVLVPWTAEKFKLRVAERLTAKDRVRLQDGPYSEYLVLLHSDEPMLTASDVGGYLKATRWGPFNQISRAYLLLSYDPLRQGYPYFQLYP